jgi:hypothetical protein
MGPERDPPRPLGVKQKGITSTQEHGYTPKTTRCYLGTGSRIYNILQIWYFSTFS